jgi:hypothetical protein
VKFLLRDNRTRLWVRGEDDYSATTTEAVDFSTVTTAENYCQEQQLFNHSVYVLEGLETCVVRPLVMIAHEAMAEFASLAAH